MAEQLPRQIARKLDHGVELYADAYALRAAVQIIPWVGTPLDTILAGRAQSVQKQRLARFLEDLNEAYRRVDEQKINREFLESEEFIDLVADVFARVTRTHDEEKRRTLRNAFVNATTNEGNRGPLKDIVIRLAGDMTPAHLRVLRVVSDRQDRFTAANREANEDFTSVEHLHGALPGLSPVEIQAIALDLLAMGLVGDWSSNRYDSPPQPNKFFLSDFGRRFIWFITAPGPES